MNRKRNCGRNKNGQKIKVLVVTTILGGSVAIGQHTTLASWWLTGVKRPKQRCGQVQSFYICCVELLVCWFFGSGSIAAFMNCRRSFFLDVISPSFALSIWPEGDKEQKLWPVNFQRDANNPSLHFNRPRVEEKTGKQRLTSPSDKGSDSNVALSAKVVLMEKIKEGLSWFWLLTTLARIRNKIKMKHLVRNHTQYSNSLGVWQSHAKSQDICQSGTFCSTCSDWFFCWVTQVRWLTPDFWVRSKSCIQDCAHARRFHQVWTLSLNNF